VQSELGELRAELCSAKKDLSAVQTGLSAVQSELGADIRTVKSSIQRGLENVQTELSAAGNAAVLELVQANIMTKTGTKASAAEATKFFYYSQAPNDVWTPNAIDNRRKFISEAEILIQEHQVETRRNLLVGSTGDGKRASRWLLEELMSIYFDSSDEVKIYWGKEYTYRHLGSIIYDGRTDAVIGSTGTNAGGLCWESESLTDRLSLEILEQLGAEMASELGILDFNFGYKTEYFPGIATNGVGFVFTMAKRIKDHYEWYHSNLITDASTAARMIGGCFAVANEVLRKTTSILYGRNKRATFSGSIGTPGEGVDEDDAIELI
jgi:hypothetical protein